MMTVEEFRDYMSSGQMVKVNSDVHQMFHIYAQEALKITMEMNNQYHTPEELRSLMSRLIGREVPETFGLFPPFYTDCART